MKPEVLTGWNEIKVPTVKMPQPYIWVWCPSLAVQFFPDRYSFCTNSVFRKQGHYLLNKGRFQSSVAAVLFTDSISCVNMFFYFLQFFD